MITFSMLGQMGRLGNQMFQIAATIGHAKRIGAEYGFPPWAYSGMMESPLPVTSGVGRPYVEPHFHYAPIPPEDGLDLRGYFQSEKYFENCREDVRRAFAPSAHVMERIAPKLAEIGMDSVSVHVRRGDYVGLATHHPPVTAGYVRAAVDMVVSRGRVFVFSDDPQWCRDNLPRHYVVMPRGHELDDMVLMSRCSHNVIANSSFSWWAAWLNRNPGKVVVAPAAWFGPAYQHSLESLFPDGWRVI